MSIKEFIYNELNSNIKMAAKQRAEEFFLKIF